MVHTDHGAVCRNHLDIESVDDAELFGLSGGADGHSAHPRIERDQILESDRSEDAALGLLRYALLRFDGRMQARGPAAILRNPAFELVHGLDHAFFTR
jgi:hypothetical protein